MEERIGADLLVAWPTGTGAKGNDGVSQAVKQVKNSIGYVEYGHALQTKLSFALIQNQAGRFIRPDPASFQTAAASADWGNTSDFYRLLTDVPGADASHCRDGLRPDAQDGFAEKVRGRVGFLPMVAGKGCQTAAQLGYVPLPEPLVKQVKSYWAKNFKAGT